MEEICRVTREDLYQYCADFGLMLSWGIPLTKVLLELEKSQRNPFLREISKELYEKLLCGTTIVEVLEKFPSVFRAAFVKWIRLGARFGILDKVIIEIAGVLRFDYLLMKEDSSVSREELGRFLIKLSDLLKENSSKEISAIRELTCNEVILEWLTVPLRKKGAIFHNSQKGYYLIPIYRKIASPLFWQMLDTAETCGYLPDMLEILGLYLIDKDKFLPSDEAVAIEKIDKESTFSVSETILSAIEKTLSGKLIITSEKDSLTFLMDGKERDFSSLTGLASCNREKIYSVISSLKILFSLDAAEKCLPQKSDKEYNINGRNYRVYIKITPHYEGLKPDEIHEGTEIIEIELKGI